MRKEKTYRVSCEVASRELKDVVVEVLEYLERFGNLGCSRSIIMGVKDNYNTGNGVFSNPKNDGAPIEVYIDGDGADRFVNDITVEEIEVIKENKMKFTKKQLEELIESKAKDIINNKILNEGPDGWDKSSLQDIGLMDWFKSVEEVAYDIRNCRRGAYCRKAGTTYEELGSYLLQLADELEGIARELSQNFDDEDYDDEDYDDEGYTR